jgi:outer membrane protein TolC
MEVGKQLPSIAVGAGYNYHNLLDNDRHFGMVFATVSVPISDWWAGSHAIRRRRIAERQAQEQLADNAQLLTIRMQKARNDVEEAQSQLDLAQQSIDQAAENLRIHRDTYQAGTATMSDLLQAQLLYQQTLDQRTDAYIALQTALLDYRHATGQ